MTKKNNNTVKYNSAMDKKLIEENNLNEALDHFKHLAEYKHPKQSLKNLYEYTFITNRAINEDGEEEMSPQQQGGDMQPLPQGQEQGNAPQGTPMPQGDGVPMGEPMHQEGANGAPMGMQSNDIPLDNANMMQQSEGVPMPTDGMGDGVETQEMEPDDEVIDVDELTQSQEATEYKIDGVDDRIAKLYAAVKKFGEQLDKNAESINDLKNEFEKRNPTEEERLNLRSQYSAPFSESPKDYWDNKVKQDPHYNVIYDNEVSPSDEETVFEITKDDIDGLDMKSISDTLDTEQNLKDYIGF